MNRGKAHVQWLAALAVLMLPFGTIIACEVTGFSFNERVSARELFADFRHRGAIHPHGWGVALYPDKSAQLIKDGKPAMQSDLAEFLTRYKGLEAEIFIAFVRTASPGCGEPSHQSSHPFLRELNGRDFVLAHEGTIYDFRSKLELNRARPLGINDSEFLCCYLAGQIEKAGVLEWNSRAFSWLEQLLHQTSKLGSVTSMFSDGEYLFVYLDPRDANDLFYVRRAAPYGKVYFKNMKQELDLGKIYAPSARGIIFATRPLTIETWTPLPAGSLTVLRTGEIIYTTPAPQRASLKKEGREATAGRSR
jgi:glutamine amidotransferase